VPGVKQNSTGGHEERLAAIVEATGAFSDAVPDVDALLGIIAEHIRRATGDFCAVVLLSPGAELNEWLRGIASKISVSRSGALN
jgi:hypothetical protein